MSALSLLIETVVHMAEKQLIGMAPEMADAAVKEVVKEFELAIAKLEEMLSSKVKNDNPT
jgi:hypothetical protein